MNTASNLNIVAQASRIEHATNNTNDNIGATDATQQPQPKPAASTPTVTSTAPMSNNDVTTTTTTNTTTSTTTTNTTAATTTTIAAAAASAVTNGSITESRASTDGHKTPNVSTTDSLSKTNLYIRGLQLNTSDQDLYNMCSRFGQISSTKAILEKTTGYCRGYGFVEFNSPQSAELAVKELTKSGVQAQMAKITPLYSSHPHNNNHNQHHHHHHHNKQHHHDHHHHHNHNNASSGGGGGSGSGHSGGGGGTSSNNHNNSGHNTSATSNNSSQHHFQNSSNNNNADPTNLYIANLPPNMSEQELENLLSTYGPVVSTRILRDQSNIPRGVGFARMETRDKCEQIIEQLNGRPCKGWKEPLLIKFADGGNKKRSHHNNQHQHHNHHHHHHQHQNNNHHNQHQKIHQDDNRWRESGNPSDLGSVTSFEHQSNISHSNHLTDLAMMGTLSYPRIQPGFPPTVAAGAAYHPPQLGPPTSAPQWIHPGGPGQPYVIPSQMIQAGGMGQSNQAPPPTALHYGHIPQITSQMQALQIAHPGAPVGGYLPHQWSPLWTHPIPQQPQPSVRLPGSMQPPLPSQQPQHQAPIHHQQQQQQLSPQSNIPTATIEPPAPTGKLS